MPDSIAGFVLLILFFYPGMALRQLWHKQGRYVFEDNFTELGTIVALSLRFSASVFAAQFLIVISLAILSDQPQFHWLASTQGSIATTLRFTTFTVGEQFLLVYALVAVLLWFLGYKNRELKRFKKLAEMRRSSLQGFSTVWDFLGEDMISKDDMVLECDLDNGESVAGKVVCMPKYSSETDLSIVLGSTFEKRHPLPVAVSGHSEGTPQNIEQNKLAQIQYQRSSRPMIVVNVGKVKVAGVFTSRQEFYRSRLDGWPIDVNPQYPLVLRDVNGFEIAASEGMCFPDNVDPLYIFGRFDLRDNTSAPYRLACNATKFEAGKYEEMVIHTIELLPSAVRAPIPTQRAGSVQLDIKYMDSQNRYLLYQSRFSSPIDATWIAHAEKEGVDILGRQTENGYVLDVRIGIARLRGGME